MRVKTSELTGAALDWAVACITKAGVTGVAADGKLRSMPNEKFAPIVTYSPSSDWSQGGPIIEREGISWHCGNKTSWHAYAYGSSENFSGPAPLIAAMRCYVASKLGDVVEIPEALCE